MAYDTARQRTVLFGGAAGGAPLADTWEWDGTTWFRRTAPVAPPGVSAGRLAHDPGRGVTVLFGGHTGSGHSAETWEWNGVDWARRQPTTSPTGRRQHALVYDGSRRALLLFGGIDSTGQVADTWELSTQAGSYTSFGSGCPGPRGVPVLIPNQAPRIGQPFSVILSNLPLHQPGVMYLGLSRSMWGVISLPLDLNPLGLQGCRLYVSLELGFGLGSTGPFGVVPWGFTLPGDQSVVGAEFFNQAFVLDLTANPGGLVTTNAGHGVVGF
jgi:hypothetical protein